MPRLALSLPTELGPGDRTRTEERFRSAPTMTDQRSIERSDPEDGAEERPPIEQWLSCWAEGSGLR